MTTTVFGTVEDVLIAEQVLTRGLVLVTHNVGGFTRVGGP